MNSTIVHRNNNDLIDNEMLEISQSDNKSQFTQSSNINRQPRADMKSDNKSDDKKEQKDDKNEAKRWYSADEMEQLRAQLIVMKQQLAIVMEDPHKYDPSEEENKKYDDMVQKFADVERLLFDLDTCDSGMFGASCELAKKPTRQGVAKLQHECDNAVKEYRVTIAKMVAQLQIARTRHHDVASKWFQVCGNKHRFEIIDAEEQVVKKARLDNKRNLAQSLEFHRTSSITERQLKSLSVGAASAP